MTTFKKSNVVLNLSIDGANLYVLDLSTDETTTFSLNLGVSIQNISSSEIDIKEEGFPTGGVPFVIEISSRWASISYDWTRDLVFACGIGVGMDVLDRMNDPEYEDNYSGGIDAKTYFNDLSKHKLFMLSNPSKTIQFRSLNNS